MNKKNQQVRIGTDFHNQLKVLLKRAGVKCNLKHKNNNFLKNKDIVWTGSYICSNSTCNIDYKVILKNGNKDKILQLFVYILNFVFFKEDDMKLKVSWSGVPNHENFLTEKSCRSKERTDQSLQTRSYGISNSRNENMIQNYLNDSNEKPTSRDVLRKINQESYHRNRISNDVIIDLCATKKSHEFNFLLQNNSKIKGYLHELSVDPFGAIFFSNIQVYLQTYFFLTFGTKTYCTYI